MNNTEYLSCILTDEIFPSEFSNNYKRSRTFKKHLLSITHYTQDGTYFVTHISYKISWDKKIYYSNVNIYNDTEFSFLIASYENKLSTYKGIPVTISKAHTREYSYKKISNDEQIFISNEIYINLKEPHLIDFDKDNEYFRSFNIKFNISDYGVIRWVQKQNRPALYIDSVDTTNTFDENSISLYICADKIKSDLQKDIQDINNKIDSVQHTVGRFVGHLFSYVMMLYYINMSYGWKLEDISYEKLWNLAMYMISVIKPFEYSCKTDEDKKLKNDWLSGIKIGYVKFLFCRRVFNNLGKGIKKYYRDLANSKMIRKVTRYNFPEYMTKEERKDFKKRFSKPKTNNQLIISKRDAEILELKEKGFKLAEIAEKTGTSLANIKRILYRKNK